MNRGHLKHDTWMLFVASSRTNRTQFVHEPHSVRARTDSTARERGPGPQRKTALRRRVHSRRSPWGHWSDGNGGSPALLFELQSLPLALHCLRALRAQFAAMPAVVSVPAAQLAAFPSTTGFDDFVLQPCTPLEVRTRIRNIARRRAGSATVPQTPLDARLEGDSEQDGMRVDAVSHEALVEGETIRLTAREFALFAYLRERRGRVLSRQHLLERVWGHRYHGGPRTVDTHIGRLRLEFGAALPIETVGSNAYRLGQGAQELPAQESAAE